MSIQTTNTPNGASKDLYENNKDEIALNYVDCNAVNNEDLINWQVPGDGIEVYDNKTINVSDAIRESGSVKIKVTLIGEPMIASPETENTIKLSVAEVKKALAAKGAITSEAYIQAKKDRLEKKDKEEELEEDKNKDSNDDRNQ